MLPTRRLLVWVVAALTFAAIAAVVFLGLRGALTGGTRLAPPAAPPVAARPAPDFRLQTFDRRAVALSDFRGQVVVLNFWASWCTPCKQEMPNLERAWNEFKDRGVVVLGIDVLDDIEDAAAFMRALKITYPSVYDPEQTRMNAYQVTALPTTIFIDRQQRIRKRFVGGYQGPAGYEQLRREVEDLLRSTP